MNILLADDHELVRDTIAAFLERETDMTLTTVEDVSQACAKLDADGPVDLVLLDYTMPGMNGLDGLQTVLDKNDGNPVAIMSGTASKSVAQDALNQGAIGFLPKTMGAKSLINAVRFMASGETYVPVAFMTAEAEEEISPLAQGLSQREMQVLEGLCQGKSNKELARDLELQEVTIKLHVKTLCRKIDAKNRTQAAMIAKDAGLF